MKVLSAEMTSLLDKLYNLRGKDSVVLASMDKEKEAAVETRDKTSSLKAELQAKINTLTEEENILADEGAKLQAALSAINKKEFATIITHLDIDFDPESLRKSVDERLPETIEKVASEKKSAGEELVKVEDEMNEAITKIEELGIRRDEAISNQERLNKYFDLALNSNINITRDEISSLLAKFDFTEEEQREAAKLLMFPEDGLFDYEKGYSQTRQAIKQAENSSGEVKIPITTIPKVEVSTITLSDNKPILQEVETESLIVAPPVTDNKPKETTTKDELLTFLKKYSFDELDFTANDIELMIANFNAELFTKNIELLDKYGFPKDIFFDNIELMYDSELDNKIQRLIIVGKTIQDIYLNPNVLIKYNMEELNNAIKVLTESGLDPKSVPLMAY